MGASTAWGHEVVPLTGDKLALAIELGETCGARDCEKSPTWVTSYSYVTGRAGRTSKRHQRVCADHALTFADKHNLLLTHDARRAAAGDWDNYEEDEQP
jgi:hypothetical protein